jgi:tetrahydromethanopterin S-methyltransferase subunit A
MRVDRDKIIRLLADLIKVGDIEKCRTCHCYLDVLRQVQEDILSRDLAGLPEAEALDEMIGRAYAEQCHGCLGCDPCLPVDPFNAFNERLEKDRAQGSCCTPAPGETQPVPDPSPSWPPLPGDYTVMDKDAPGAVCTLADEELYEALRKALLPGVALVGTLTTENLGIERLVRNVVANPSISWLLLCGTDSRGHRAGECLAALSENGVDSEMRIVGAPGKRARLVNLSFEETEAFRTNIRVVRRTGWKDVGEISRLLEGMGKMPSADRAGGVFPIPAEEKIAPQPESAADAAGYFVIDISAERGVLRLEHHTADHRLTAVLVGSNARDLYLSAVRRGLVSRLDHAAYLGYELGKAERALMLKTRYVRERVDPQGGGPISVPGGTP